MCQIMNENQVESKFVIHPGVTINTEELLMTRSHFFGQKNVMSIYQVHAKYGNGLVFLKTAQTP